MRSEPIEVAPLVLRALAPADAVRAAWLRMLGPLVRPLLRDRGLRVLVGGASSCATALALATYAPLALLTIGPLLLGIPHLLADLRYLVVRQGLHRRSELKAWVAPFLLLSVLAPGRGFGICAVGAATVVAGGPRVLRGAAFAGCAAAWLMCRELGLLADVFLAHAHNLVAVAFWVAWTRAPAPRKALLLSFFALPGALILSGALDPLIAQAETWTASRWAGDGRALLRTLALSDHPIWAPRLAVLFAFAQAVHYGVWLRLVPDEDRARAGVRSFAASYRALTRDLGSAVVLASVGLCVGLLAFALSDLSAARHLYLRIALFHGPLEIAVALLLALERRALVRGS